MESENTITTKDDMSLTPLGPRFVRFRDAQGAPTLDIVEDYMERANDEERFWHGLGLDPCVGEWMRIGEITRAEAEAAVAALARHVGLGVVTYDLARPKA